LSAIDTAVRLLVVATVVVSGPWSVVSPPPCHAACPVPAEDEPVLVHSIDRDPGTDAVRITFDSCPDHLYELRLLPAPTNTADAATTVLETLIGNDTTTLVTDPAGPITQPRYYQVKRITFDGDADNDSLANLDEFQRGLNLNNPDSDADRLLDGWEVFWGLDPLDNTGDHGGSGDPDGDTVDNATEQRQGRNPTKGAVPDTTGVTGLQVFTPLE